MNSSKHKTPETLAAPSEDKTNIDALVELANLKDDPAAFERFARRWPVFARVLDYDPSDDFPKASNMTPEEHQKYFEQHGYYKTTYRGLSYGELPNRMPPNVPGKFVLTWQMREALRKIWRGSTELLTVVLFGTLDDVFADPDPEWPWPPQLEVDWQRGAFVYVPRGEFQQGVYRLFRSSALAKVCANPDCPAPYFIAGRTTQQYCSEKCSGVKQKQHKLRWWREHGNELRSRKRSRGKRGKR